MTENTAPASEDTSDDEFETIGDYHRMAAHPFGAAAKHHEAAAAADAEGNEEAHLRHAHLAYRHQLGGVQYAEIAAMESESPDDEFDTQSSDEQA